MLNRVLTLFGLMLLLIVPVTAQDAAATETGNPSLADSTSWVCPEGFTGQTLAVRNWENYISLDVIDAFNELCAVVVDYDTYDSDRDIIRRVRAGNSGIDLFVSGDENVRLMIEEGLLQELDKSRIPNLANLDAEFQSPPHDATNTYSIPYQFGTFGVGYNTERVDEEITSWEQVFSYEGNVAWYDSAQVMLSLALRMTGNPPNSVARDEIAEARNWLVENSDNVSHVVLDEGSSLLASGQVDIVLEYSGNIYQLRNECDCTNIRYVIPEEGSIKYIDAMVIPIDANNKALAETFIDFILDPVISAYNSSSIAYATPNALARDMMQEDYYPDDVSNLNYIPTLSQEQRLIYSEAWLETKIILSGR